VNEKKRSCYSEKSSVLSPRRFQKISNSFLVVFGDDVKTSVLASRDESGMERRFTVEAKTFFFSMKASQLRLEERRKGFLGLILVDRRGASWLAATVEEASQSPTLVDFDKSSSEGRKSLSVKGDVTKVGGSWRWWLSWTTIGRVSFGSLRLAQGGVGRGL
jgi:hypothetical protein